MENKKQKAVLASQLTYTVQEEKNSPQARLEKKRRQSFAIPALASSAAALVFQS